MGDIDDILNTDDVKDIVEALSEEVDNIEGLIVAYTLKDGGLKWKSNCRRSEGLGIFEVVHQDLLHHDSMEDRE